jgi:ABC-type multidrug transport system fused ATPase/permease subunit
MKTAWRLLPYVWPHWRGLAGVFLTMVLGVGMDVLRPWPMKLLADHVLEKQPLPPALSAVATAIPVLRDGQGLLLGLCAATVLIFFAHGLIAMAYTASAVTFGQRMVYDLGADLFLHLQRLSLLFHSRRPVGDTVGRVTVDTYCLQVLISSAILPLVQSLVTVVVMFVVLWRLEPVMTLSVLGVVPAMMLLIYLFGGPMKKRSREQRDLEGHLMSLVEQTLAGIPAVQAFTREEQEYGRFREYAAKTVAAYRRSVSVDMWFKLLIGLTTALGTALVMWLGAGYALEGRVTIGTILVFLAYLAMLYEPLNSIVYTTSMLQHAAASADRVVELLNMPADVRDAPEAAEITVRGEVRFEDVTFGYAPGWPVLKGVSLEVCPGEVVAIVGPTGAGKTTLVNLLLRFFDPQEGRVLLDGHDLRKLKVRSLRQQVAMVLQEPFIFPLTVAENLAYGKPDAARTEIVAAAQAANADEFICRLPQGYDTIIGERGATLSGGEKQRLSIARAFLKDAPVLILDEPTSALDAHTEGLVLEAVERLMAGRTTVIIAHRLSTVQRADRIVVLDEGRCVEAGTPDELLQQGGLYARLHRIQFSHAHSLVSGVRP